MNNRKEDKASIQHKDLTIKEALSLASSVSALLSNAKLLGSKHSTTRHVADELCQKISRLTEKEDKISLIILKNTLYVENYIVSKHINAQKLLAEFEKLGIHSITFTSDVLPWGLITFAKYYTDALELEQGADKISEELQSLELDSIILNLDSLVSVPRSTSTTYVPILTHKATTHFIKRYIEEFYRHRNPFSLIAISSKSSLKALPITEEIYDLSTKSFRILDLSGIIKVRSKEVAIVIFPMTKTDGMDAILKRLTAQMEEKNLSLSSMTVSYCKSDLKDLNYAGIMKKLLREHV